MSTAINGGEQPAMVKIDPDKLIFMRGIVKTYNQGKDTELTVLHLSLIHI